MNKMRMQRRGVRGDFLDFESFLWKLGNEDEEEEEESESIGRSW